MRSHVLGNRVQQAFTWTIFSCIATGWSLYIFFGHQLINLMYKSKSSWIADKIMEGRASTPVENYYREADATMLFGTLWLAMLCLALLTFIRKPHGVFLAGPSLFLSSFLLFCFFEMFPSLIKPAHFDIISRYYAYKANYVYDNELVFREIPSTRAVSDNFKGGHYSPVYGIDVPPETVDWRVDENGFRNDRAKEYADIVVIGDSYVEFGNNQADTFVAKLEKRLPGLNVMNLGKSGYGPFQYLYVLKRYGVKYKPKYALLGFYEGNDIGDTRSYLKWKKGETTKAGDLFYLLPRKTFIQRYWIASTETVASIAKAINLWVQLASYKIAQVRGYGYNIHPDLALISIGDRKYYKLFIDTLSTTSTEDMLGTEGWGAFGKILGDFRDVCAKNNIVPIIVYIPAPVHIYAQFSSEASGTNWLAIQDGQIAAKENTANGVKHLARELNIPLVDLSPVFEDAAKEGHMLFYPFDDHWNAEGIEIAAAFVADALQSKYNLIQ